MVEVNKQGEVWVFAEQENGELSEVPLELLSKARELADTLNVPVAAMMLGEGVGDLCRPLIEHGADKVYLVDDARLRHYQTTPYAHAICRLIEDRQPQICLYGATPLGRDLAPTVASKLRCGLTADCTDLQIGDHEVKKTGKTYTDLMYQIRPAFGGNIIATIVNVDWWPQMATVREGVMPLSEKHEGRQGEIIRFDPVFPDLPGTLVIHDGHREEKKIDLKGARIIVAGGAGVGSRENFQQIWDLAHCLGATVGGSRAAVDLGYVDKDHQVGQTGTTVRPALYIAVGISGAVQHMAGMSESAKILAVNNNSDVDMFNIAHYGIVGDLNDVVPMLIKAVRGGLNIKTSH